MGGFSSITGDETIMFADNASFDGTERGGKMTINGQLWIGATASPHVKLGNLTSPDTSVTIGYSSPNITLQVNTALLFKWQDVSGTFISNKNNGYFITATASSTLPAGASQGDTIKYALDTANALTLTASAGQKIRLGSSISSTAGTAVSTATGDSLTLVFKASDQVWIATSIVGNWTTA